jgi:hypothetical protein
MRRLLTLLLVLGMAVLPARATWSIVVVNTRTGEVAVASATCLDGFDLVFGLPVIVPGVGAGAAQSVVDQSGTNRKKIWDLLQAGQDPQAIIAQLASGDPQYQSRQYGIVNMNAFPATFTGNNAFAAKYGIAGVSDELRYAIQGNILVGVLPVYAAEAALLSTPGDLSQKLVAAMEAARAAGGDGRCSCSINAPTSCGAPPPNFQYSAYTGFIIVSRVGDTLGVCGGSTGCANGNYYLNLNAVSGAGGPEPVLLLESAYQTWRTNQVGYADHILSEVVTTAPRLPADGTSSVRVTVQLKDINGGSVTQPLSALQVIPAPGNPNATIGTIENLGAGRYRFSVRAGSQTGTGRWRIFANHPGRDVRLYPDLTLALDPLAPTHCGYDELSAAQGGRVPLVVNFGPSNANEPFRILGSMSGSTPPTLFEGVLVSLANDTFFESTRIAISGPRFEGTYGTLDSNGRAQGFWIAPAGTLNLQIGRRVDWVAVKRAGTSPAVAGNNDGLLIVP